LSLRTGSKVSICLGLFFGWIWIISFFAFPILILWTIFGDGKWYYALISFAVGSFCKALCREYKIQSEDMFYESTDKDYAAEWIALPEPEKRESVIQAFSEIAIKYHPKSDIDSLIEEYARSNVFDDMVKNITDGYRETRLQKPYQIICSTYVDSVFLSLAGDMGTPI
jgi:hypothetical protein